MELKCFPSSSSPPSSQRNLAYIFIATHTLRYERCLLIGKVTFHFSCHFFCCCCWCSCLPKYEMKNFTKCVINLSTHRVKKFIFLLFCSSFSFGFFVRFSFCGWDWKGLWIFETVCLDLNWDLNAGGVVLVFGDHSESLAS